MTGVLIRNARLLDPVRHTDELGDVLVVGETIAALGPPATLSAADGVEIIDGGAGRLWVMPGLVDLHVHLREPGEEYKEDIESGSRAAAAGGFTTIVAMANTKPVADNAEVIRYVLERGRSVGLCRVLPVGAVTMGQAGETLAPFGELKAAGAVALSDDGHWLASSRLCRSALEYAQDFCLGLHMHAEDPGLSAGGLMHEGAVSTGLGLRGIPGAAEDVAVARDLILAEATGGRLHICHVSTARSVELIRAAKARGVRVTAEATPHHFTLTDEAVVGFDPNTKMRPPLRGVADRQAVIAGLADGTIDAIATDHAPHSTIEKDAPYEEAANGIIGLQTALPLALALWRAGGLSLLNMVERLTTGPLGVLGMTCPGLARGAPADLAILDPECTFDLTAAALMSKSKNSPFVGWQLKGAVETTLLGGRATYRRHESK